MIDRTKQEFKHVCIIYPSEETQMNAHTIFFNWTYEGITGSKVNLKQSGPHDWQKESRK